MAVDYQKRLTDDGAAALGGSGTDGATRTDSTVTCAGGGASAKPTEAPHPVPDRAGRYRFERLLGQGAFGAVYVAFDEELHRQVAIKVPHRERFETEADAESYLREARAAAHLSHRGIVTVFDCGRLDDGRVFVVMELHERSLADEMRGQPLPPTRCAEVMAALAEAIHHAHQHGFVHRDLKPSNILIDGASAPRISDFGLVLLEETQHSHAGEVSGSPAYMSPELTRGESHRLDGRSDIWSLGVIFYEMLTGRRPFRGRDRTELFDEICHREPKPPRQIRPDIPRELERCCLRCLAKPLGDRYTTSLDLAAELRQWLAEQSSPPAAPLPAPVAPPASPARVVRWPITVGGLALVVAALAGWWWGRPEVPGPSLPPIGEARSRPPSDVPPPGRTPSPVPASLDELPAGEWHPLLERSPHVLRWPELRRNSRWGFVEQDRELWVSCDEMALFELGRVRGKNFRFRVRFSQANWVGGTGVFFGYHEPSVSPGLPRVQLVELDSYFPTNADKAFNVARKLVTLDDNVPFRESITLGQCPTAQPGMQDVKLEIVVRDGHVAHVFWQGHEQPELADEHLKRMLDLGKVTADDCAGAIGLYCNHSQATFHDPTIFLETTP